MLVLVCVLPCCCLSCSFKPSRRSDVSHVVITGALDGPTVKGVRAGVKSLRAGVYHYSLMVDLNRGVGF